MFIAVRFADKNTLFVMLAAFCWGLSGGVGGMLIDAGWNAITVAFYRGLIGLVCVLLWLTCRPHRNGLTRLRLWLWSALAGLGVAGNFGFYFLSIAEGNVAVAATLMYSAPVFVLLVSFLLHSEAITLGKCLAIVLVILGIGLLTQVHDMAASELSMYAVVAGILAGLSYALFIFGFKYALGYGSRPAILSIAFSVLVVVLIIPASAADIFRVSHHADLPLFILLGLLGAGLSFVLYVTGLQWVAPSVAAMLAMLEPVTAALFGVLILQQSLSSWQFVGMALIMLTVTVLSVTSSTADSTCQPSDN